MKVVINKCYGGFGLSDEAYEKLIEWGIPVRKYIEQKRGGDGRYERVPENEGEVIFDRELTLEGEDSFNDLYYKYKDKSDIQGRYWETWLRSSRSHPLLIRVVEELGTEKASSKLSELKVVEIPNGLEYEIEEYDGREWVAEKHQTWS